MGDVPDFRRRNAYEFESVDDWAAGLVIGGDPEARALWLSTDLDGDPYVFDHDQLDQIVAICRQLVPRDTETQT